MLCILTCGNTQSIVFQSQIERISVEEWQDSKEDYAIIAYLQEGGSVDVTGRETFAICTKLIELIFIEISQGKSVNTPKLIGPLRDNNR